MIDVVQDEQELKLIDDNISYLKVSSHVEIDWHMYTRNYINEIQTINDSCQLLGHISVDTIVTYTLFDEITQSPVIYKRNYADIGNIPDNLITNWSVQQSFLLGRYVQGDTLYFDDNFSYASRSLLYKNLYTNYFNELGGYFYNHYELLGDWAGYFSIPIGYVLFKITKEEATYYGWIHIKSEAGKVTVLKVGYYKLEN